MDSIAVTKPNMAVTNRDRLGLSLFGLLSLAFGDEVRSRSAWQTGLYREVPLELLEEQETAPESAAAERPLQLDVDLKVVLETLKKENAKADKRQEKVVERILERVYLLEKQVSKAAPAQAHVNVHWAAGAAIRQTGGKAEPRRRRRAARRAGADSAGSSAGGGQGGRHCCADGESGADRPEDARAARSARRPQQPCGRRSAPVRAGLRIRRSWSGWAVWLHRLHRSHGVPPPRQGDGWKPHWQEEHPGFCASVCVRGIAACGRQHSAARSTAPPPGTGAGCCGSAGAGPGGTRAGGATVYPHDRRTGCAYACTAGGRPAAICSSARRSRRHTKCAGRDAKGADCIRRYQKPGITRRRGGIRGGSGNR